MKMTKNVNELIGNELMSLGISPNLKGYGYLKTAIELSLSDNSIVTQITNKLYPEIARIHDSTSSRVERAIRHSIEVAFLKSSSSNIFDYFGNIVDSVTGKATNSEFISVVSEKLRFKIQKENVDA